MFSPRDGDMSLAETIVGVVLWNPRNFADTERAGESMLRGWMRQDKRRDMAMIVGLRLMLSRKVMLEKRTWFEAHVRSSLACWTPPTAMKHGGNMIPTVLLNIHARILHQRQA